MDYKNLIGSFLVGVLLIITELIIINTSKAIQKFVSSHPKFSINLLNILLCISILVNVFLVCIYIDKTSSLDPISVETLEDIKSSHTINPPVTDTEPIETIVLPDNIRPGKTIHLGRYEHDTDPDNELQEIEWIVLTCDSDKALVISTMGLDTRPYSTSKEATWSTSTLQQWLNGTFFYDAFTKAEQAIILTSPNEQHENPGDPTCYQGPVTNDHVFLLSMEEYDKYIYNNGNIETEYRYGKPTAYALKQKADAEGYHDYCWWWLRTSANDNKNACSVTAYGAKDHSYHEVNASGGLVRPAIWIDLSKIS